MTRTILSTMTPTAVATAAVMLLRQGLPTIRSQHGHDAALPHCRSARLTATRSDEQPATTPVDYEWDDTPVPCGHCRDWSAEVTRDEDAALILREWHQADCDVPLDFL